MLEEVKTAVFELGGDKARDQMVSQLNSLRNS